MLWPIFGTIIFLSSGHIKMYACWPENVNVKFNLRSSHGKSRNELNWTEQTGSRPNKAGKLNWTNSFCTFLNLSSITSTTPQTSKEAQPGTCIILPTRWQISGWRAGISTGGNLELLLCSSKKNGDSMARTEPESNDHEIIFRFRLIISIVH